MKVSVLTTLYYSSPYLDEFYRRALEAVSGHGMEYEFVLVNDGSPDDVLQKAITIASRDPHVTIVDLSRNFGHHKAIMTGLQYCKGDIVYLIDCDLEEDPALFGGFWEKMKTDPTVDVVYGVQVRRKGAWFERWSGWLFYRLISALTSMDYPANSLTARIMTKRYVEAVLSHKETELELWGLFVLSGFKQVAVPSHKEYKGSTTYTMGRKIKVAIDAITSLSNKPLYWTFVIGLLSVMFSLVNIAIILYKKFVLQNQIEGWSSIVASIWMVGGLILFVLGIFGIYLSKMFNEIKQRPLSIVRKVYGGGVQS